MIVLGMQGHPHPSRAAPADFRSTWDHGWYHDSAAVVLVDGAVVGAVEEERISRRKHTGRLPVQAAAACLQLAGCTIDDVDLVAFGEEGGSGPFRDASLDRTHLARVLEQELGFTTNPTERLLLVDHHLAHAVSAYAASGFDASLVFTTDGFGDGASGSVIDAHQARLAVLDVIPVDGSLGDLYGAPLPLLGFGDHDEFKMMGLAPYGNPANFEKLFSAAYELLPDGAYRFDRRALRAGLAQLGTPRRRDEPFSARDRNVAAAAQAALERIVFHVLAHFRLVTGQRSLCAAGGVMQNSTLNGKIAASGLFDRVFVQPAASDCGLALGAAYVGYLKAGPRTKPAVTTPGHVYWGRPIGGADEVDTALARWADLITYERCDDVVEHAADLLAAGAVIGWVQGRSEFGPRALGNRSILADPRPAANKDLINAMVKMREPYRPFAPAVRAEDAAEFFVIPPCVDAAYMTFVVPVRPQHRDGLAAVTHVDGSARVQVVSRQHNERFWRLIGAFGARTGTPVLLNTSFNNNHEPIVDSIDDAVTCFLTTGLDMLVVGDHVVRNAGVPAAAVLGLSPALPDDTCLALGPGGAEPVFLLLTPTEQIPVSAAAYRWLAAGLAGFDERVMDPGHTDEAALAAELFDLWQRRVIRLGPATDRLRVPAGPASAAELLQV